MNTYQVPIVVSSIATPPGHDVELCAFEQFTHLVVSESGT
jgi:hypothetical protein